MSIYPKRLKPGDQLFVHLGYQVDAFCRPLVRILLNAPDGTSTLLHDFSPILAPAPPSAVARQGKPQPEFRKAPPLYLLARQFVSPNDGNADQALEVLKKLREKTHSHFCFEIPTKTPPGKYEVTLELRSEGEVISSGTAAHDHFFVELLHVVGFKKTRRGVKAVIRNPSLVPVPVCVWKTQRGSIKATEELLKPGETQIALSRHGKAYLSYAEGREVLPLFPSASPIVSRNEAFSWSENKDGTVLVFDRDPKVPGYELSGTARDIWLAADGLSQADEIRVGPNRRVYDRLKRQGLLVEFPIRRK